MTEPASFGPFPIDIFKDHIVLVPNRGDVGMGQKQQAEITEDRFRQVDYHVVSRVPRQEDACLRAPHRIDRPVEKANAWVASSRVRFDARTIRRLGRSRSVMLGMAFDFAFGQAAHPGRLGVRKGVMKKHRLHPAIKIGPCCFDFDGKRQCRTRFSFGIAKPSRRVIGRGRPCDIRLDIPQCESFETRGLQMLHITFEHLGRGVNPRVCRIRYAVKLQHDDLAGGGLGKDLLEMLESPVGVRVPRCRNQQRVVTGRIKRRPGSDFSVGRLRLHTAASEAVAEVSEFCERFRSEPIAAPGKALRLRDADLGQGVLDQVQLTRQTRGISGDRKVCVGPAMVTDLETHLVDFSDLGPRHEILGVRHPTVSDEERGVEA